VSFGDYVLQIPSTSITGCCPVLTLLQDDQTSDSIMLPYFGPAKN